MEYIPKRDENIKLYTCFFLKTTKKKNKTLKLLLVFNKSYEIILFFFNVLIVDMKG